MYNSFPFRSFISVLSVLAFTLVSCDSQPAHPNQLNAFDGASYDTLTLAHGALLSFRAQISTCYPKYVPLFNNAAQSYAAAYQSYAVYRSAPASTSALTLALTDLTVSLVAFEQSVQSDLPVSPSQAIKLRQKIRGLRERAARQQLTVSDVLTELEIAAALASTVPASSSGAAVASMVIQATQQALTAEASAAGQPINLSTIQPIPAL